MVYFPQVIALFIYNHCLLNMGISSKWLRLALVFGILFAVLVGVIFVAANSVRADKDDDSDGEGISALLEGKKDFRLNEFPKQFLKNRATNTPSTIIINPKGKVLLGATEVVESNWPNLRVKSWGLVLNVHVMPDAKLTGVGNTTASTTASTTPTIAVGDKIDVLGDIEVATGLIHARHVRNRSIVNQQSDDLQSRIKKLLEEIERMRAQLKELKRGAGAALGNILGH